MLQRNDEFVKEGLLIAPKHICSTSLAGFVRAGICLFQRVYNSKIFENTIYFLRTSVYFH